MLVTAQHSDLTPWLNHTPEVKSALETGKPVVAFETTVLSFGLPYPSNMETGQRCEAAAFDHGCTPATLGLIDGRIALGMQVSQMEQFCHAGAEVVKVNLQNIASALLQRHLGAFTVAASVQVANLAGIPVFATGGIGGVHRGYSSSHDVSSDLVALARFPVAVVCAGIKSILDVPATLEHLETLGVPVIGYRTKTFPLFHARESKIPVEIATDSIDEVAALVRTHWALGGKGILVVTPVPEEHAVDPGVLEEWIASAHRAAQVGRVSGKAVTPFLLKKLEELSHGKSIITNMALLENNARTGAELARAMANSTSE